MAEKDMTQIEVSDHPPGWIRNEDITLINDDIKDIIRFFVINTPCFETSARAKSFTQYGWSSNNPKPNDYLYKKLLETANLIMDQTLFVLGESETTKDLFARANLGIDFKNYFTVEKVAMVKDSNLIIGICRMIRNCFAHCRVSFVSIDNDLVVAMENGQPRGKASEGKKFEVKGRLLLKVSTLKEWIRIIEEDAHKEKEFLEVNNKNYEKALLAVIRTGEYSDTDDMCGKTEYDKSLILKAKKRLVGKKVIEYSRKEKKWIVLLDEGNK